MFKAIFGKKEKICKNCIAYNGKLGICNVIILHEGQKINLPVSANDSCFFEQKVINPDTGEEETLNEIAQVRIWCEDEKGIQSENGTVKVEYPVDFVPKKVN